MTTRTYLLGHIKIEQNYIRNCKTPLMLLSLCFIVSTVCGWMFNLIASGMGMLCILISINKSRKRISELFEQLDKLDEL